MTENPTPSSSIEDATGKIIAGTLIEIFKRSIDTLPKLAERIKKGNKKHDYFGNAARRYQKKLEKRYLEKRYNVIRIFAQSSPVPLRDIYVRVNILEKLTPDQRVAIDDLKKQFTKNQSSFGTIQKTKRGIEVVNELQKFIVLGKPGAGKTTYLKWLALQSLDGKTNKKRIPIFVGLKEFSDSDHQKLIDFIVEQFGICNFDDAKPFVKLILTDGKCQVLFDGLDEVSKQSEDRIIQELINFSDKYSSNQFVLSCRIAAYNRSFEKFTDVEMADFNDEQIKSFVNNWFKCEPKVAKICWEKLEADQRIKELGKIPLLLTLLCLVYHKTIEFPKNRAELYKEALDALLRDWDSSRRINRGEIYDNLSRQRKESMFARIAAETFEKDEYFIPQQKLEKYIKKFIQNLPGAGENTLELDSRKVLKAIEAQHGVFVERAKGVYSFSHLTFHEYYTAKYIVENANKGTLNELVETHLYDDKWQEVFLLVAGMLDDADDFLLLVKDEIEKLRINDSMIQL